MRIKIYYRTLQDWIWQQTLQCPYYVTSRPTDSVEWGSCCGFWWPLFPDACKIAIRMHPSVCQSKTYSGHVMFMNETVWLLGTRCESSWPPISRWRLVTSPNVDADCFRTYRPREPSCRIVKKKHSVYRYIGRLEAFHWLHRGKQIWPACCLKDWLKPTVSPLIVMPRAGDDYLYSTLKV